MTAMGFGPKMANLVHLLGSGSITRIMLNGGLSDGISLTHSLRQGCPLSPLFFAIATHPMLSCLDAMASHGEVVGLHLSHGKQLLAQAIACSSPCG